MNTNLILEKNPAPSDLTEMFKKWGYGYSWDFSKSDGIYWHEFIDPVSKKLAIQIAFDVLKDDFLRWFNGENLSIFVAGKEKSKEWLRLRKKIKDEFNIEWK